MNIQTLHQKIYTVGRITPTGVKLLGTCFLLNKQGLFATASHVTNNDNTNLVIFLNNNTNLTTYQDTSNNSGQTISVSIYKVDRKSDEKENDIYRYQFKFMDDIETIENDTIRNIHFTIGSNIARILDKKLK